MATSELDTQPRIGELIYGCYHVSACGVVVQFTQWPAPDPCGRCWSVVEDWRGRTVRVRREANGNLYEVQ